METVTVIPEERIVSFGTSTSLIRTGIRCARRTHSKVAFTFCNRLVPVGFCVSPIPRAMLSTRPLIGAAPLIGITVAESPTWVPNETRHHGSLQVGTLVLPLSGRFLCYQNGPPLTSSMPGYAPGGAVRTRADHALLHRMRNLLAIRIVLKI
jgi:hypothetical protein